MQCTCMCMHFTHTHTHTHDAHMIYTCMYLWIVYSPWCIYHVCICICSFCSTISSFVDVSFVVCIQPMVCIPCLHMHLQYCICGLYIAHGACIMSTYTPAAVFSTISPLRGLPLPLFLGVSSDIIHYPCVYSSSHESPA